MKRVFSVLLFVFGLLIGIQSNAQVYNLKYHGFLDNREYFNPYISPQTIFGNRLSLDFGLQLDSVNAVYAGGSYLYEFGSKGDLIPPDITIYYKHKKNPASFYFGSFPRENLVRHPRVLLTDTLQYYRPNMEGTFVEVHGDWGYQNIWIDWLSRQSQTREEIFLVGYSGHLEYSSFFLNTHFIMQHIAGTSDPAVPHNLRDNGGFLAQAGVRLSPHVFLDELSLSAGPVISYDRLRGVYPLQYYYGIMARLDAEFKGAGFHYTFYKGDGQVQVMGDTFYSAKQYMRLDTYMTLYKKQNVMVRLSFGFHLLPNNLDYSQQLIVSFDLNERKLKLNK